MATKKKAAKKAKKSAKKSAKPSKPSARRKKSAPPALTQTERARLLKPRREYVSMIEQFLAVWADNKSLRVPRLTHAKLATLLKQAEKASAKEQDLLRKQEAKLRPLTDARLRAEHEVWRALLDANAQVKVSARVDAAVGEAFAFLSDAFTPARTDASESEGEATAALN